VKESARQREGSGEIRRNIRIAALAGMAVLATSVGAASAGKGVKPAQGAYTSLNVNLHVHKIDGKLVVDDFSYYPSSLSCDGESFSSGAGIDKNLKIKDGKFKYAGDADYVPEEYKLQLKGTFIKDDGVKGTVRIVADDGSCQSDRFKYTAYLIPTA
jgi:hypothetical protein